MFHQRYPRHRSYAQFMNRIRGVSGGGGIGPAMRIRNGSPSACCVAAGCFAGSVRGPAPAGFLKTSPPAHVGFTKGLSSTYLPAALLTIPCGSANSRTHCATF